MLILCSFNDVIIQINRRNVFILKLALSCNEINGCFLFLFYFIIQYLYPLPTDMATPPSFKVFLFCYLLPTRNDIEQQSLLYFGKVKFSTVELL